MTIETEAMNLKKSREEYMGGLAERKGREKHNYFITSSFRKRENFVHYIG